MIAYDSGHRPRFLCSLWLVGLFLSFLGGLLTHVYTVFLIVPFLLVELDRLLHRRRPHLWTCVALLLPPCFVAPVYLRITRIYTSGVSSGGLHVHPYEVIQHFIITVFGPGLVLVIILLALLAWRSTQSQSSPAPRPSLTREELIVALGLLLLPIFGVIAASVPDLSFAPHEKPLFRVAAGSLLGNSADQVVVGYPATYKGVAGCAGP